MPTSTTDRSFLTAIRSAIYRHQARLAVARADLPGCSCKRDDVTQPSPISTRDAIATIQRTYTRMAGPYRDLPWDTAADLWDVVRAIDDEPPSEAWMVAVSCYLVAEDYDAIAIRRIVSHIAATGGVEGCELDEGRDSEAVGELLKGRGR